MEINYGQRALEQLKAIQEKTGWTRATLAKKLDVGSGSMCNWLTYGKEPKATGRHKIDKLYKEVFNLVPPEAPENLDPLVQKYCEEDTRTAAEIAEEYLKKIKDLEPTEIERLNPPDTTSINQKPIEAGYGRFLENLRFFMKDSRCDTDEKLEMYLNLEPGYISEFGNHSDRFEELKVIGDICDYLGVPWSVLAFSDVAKEEQYARMKFRLQKLEEEMANLRLEAGTLGAQLGYISESNDEIPKS